MSEQIVIHNLQKRTKDFYLHDITMKVHEGEIMAVVGVQGSGKTLLTKILQKLAFNEGGYYDINSKSVGTVIPDQMFYPGRTCFQTLKMYAKLNKRYATRKTINNTLNIVGLRRRKNTKIKNLTPNRYARLKIAVAIAARPKILILDAPFSYMGEVEARHVRVILKTLADKFGTAIFLTGVNFFGIEEIFDTVSIIDGGSLVCIKSYNELVKKNDHLSKICITTPYPNALAKYVSENLGLTANLFGENQVVINTHPDKAQKLYDKLLENKIAVDGITRVNKSIEDLFQELRYGGTNE